jgi:hypothetical protein
MKVKGWRGREKVCQQEWERAVGASQTKAEHTRHCTAHQIQESAETTHSAPIYAATGTTNDLAFSGKHSSQRAALIAKQNSPLSKFAFLLSSYVCVVHRSAFAPLHSVCTLLSRAATFQFHSSLDQPFHRWLLQVRRTTQHSRDADSRTASNQGNGGIHTSSAR